MKSRFGSFLALVVTLTVVGSAAAYWILRVTAGGKSDAAKTPAPATQTKSVKESDLNVLTLTPEAEMRLGVRTEPLALKKLERVRVLPGEVLVPPGRSVTVSSPFAGTVKAPSSGGVVAAGTTIEKGRAMFTLVPILTNEARTALATSLVDAEGLMKNAEVSLKAASVALERAKRLVAEEAGSKRAVDETQAAFDLAQKTSEAARARRDQIANTLKGADAGTDTALNVEAPDAGVVRSVFVAPGQPVSAGAPLFEIVNMGTVWVRVPVYVGDMDTLAADRPASLARLGAGGAPSAVAKPVAAPPSATATSATRDVYYEADNKDGAWAPGQRVAVTLPLRAEADTLVAPWGAIVHDATGGAWLYESQGGQKYVRRRVQVRNVVDGVAALTAGPPPGTAVVAQGAAELFGREMGFAK